MYSVTQRIKAIKQPRGGYLPIGEFERIELGSNDSLNYRENVHPSLIGLTVDYLSRLMMVESPIEAFGVSLIGALMLGIDVKELPEDLSDKSIYMAVELASYDVAVRASTEAYKKATKPDAITIENIRILTNRVVNYHKNNPIIWSGFTFEGGYTDVVVAGDGDWLTKKGLYDLKVLRSKPNPDHTLQLLMYWLLGLDSIHEVYKDMEYIAILNPREDAVYKMELSKVDNAIIKQVRKDVLVTK